jgi:hypothetical protein
MGVERVLSFFSPFRSTEVSVSSFLSLRRREYPEAPAEGGRLKDGRFFWRGVSVDTTRNLGCSRFKFVARRRVGENETRIRCTAQSLKLKLGLKPQASTT